MDVYIRSQDNSLLIKFSKVCIEQSVDENGDLHWEIVCGSAWVGTYSTRKVCENIIDNLESAILSGRTPYIFQMPKE